MGDSRHGENDDANALAPGRCGSGCDRQDRIDEGERDDGDRIDQAKAFDGRAVAGVVRPRIRSRP
jgi:hypothetical protein